MTSMHIHPRSGARAARYATFYVFALLAVLCLSNQTYGQWVTQGSATTTTNNVGIGTPNPTAALDVRGNVVLETAGNPHLYTGTGAGELNRYLFVLNSPGLTTASGLKAGGILVSDDYGFANPAKNNLIVKGNVGIGTTTSSYPLTVRSNSNTAPLNLIGGTGNIEIWKDSNPLPSKAVAFGSAIPGNAAGDDLQLSTYNGNTWSSRLTISNSTGNVGIGTTTPGYPLTVRSNSNAAPLNLIGGTGNIEIWKDLAGPLPTKAIAFGSALPGRAAGDDIQLSTYNGNIWSSRLTISNSTGNVGIGMDAPLAKLHVAGDIRIDGNINAKYQDVAEWVPSAQKLSAGTVVILDQERSNQVLASVSSYDTKVAGVVSAQPGISLGEAGEGKVLVATTGRVKVRVDATRAPVRIGDLLVTSDMAGVAMKSEPIVIGSRRIHEPGTIIGKALESLDKGTGEILVLLSLQ